MACHFFPEIRDFWHHKKYSSKVNPFVTQLWLSYCRGISRGSLGSFVVMKSDHDEVPISIKHMPNNPCRMVSGQGERQKRYIGYHHNGTGQYHHQTNKHLTAKRKEKHKIIKPQGNYLHSFKIYKIKLKDTHCNIIKKKYKNCKVGYKI